jgi:hypothetical protein
MSIGSSDLGRLLGRADEVQLLTSLLDGVESAGGALVIRGEPGVGNALSVAEPGCAREVLRDHCLSDYVAVRLVPADRKQRDSGVEVHVTVRAAEELRGQPAAAA